MMSVGWAKHVASAGNYLRKGEKLRADRHMQRAAQLNPNVPCVPTNHGYSFGDEDPEPEAVGGGADFGFLAKGELNLKMKEKLSATGDDASIETNSGEKVFRISGKVLSFRDRRNIFYKDSKNPVGYLKTDFLAWLLKTHRLYDNNDNELAKIQRAAYLQWGCNLIIYTANETYFLQSNYFGTQGTVTKKESKTPCFTFTHKLFSSAKKMVLGLDTYNIHVLPGVDMLLVVSIIAAFDKIFHDQGLLPVSDPWSLLAPGLGPAVPGLGPAFGKSEQTREQTCAYAQLYFQGSQ